MILALLDRSVIKIDAGLYLSYNPMTIWLDVLYKKKKSITKENRAVPVKKLTTKRKSDSKIFKSKCSDQIFNKKGKAWQYYFTSLPAIK